MMEIEKKFAITDLSQFKQDAYKNFVKECYKHSNFTDKEAIKRINRLGKKEATVKQYLTAIRSYLKSKKRKTGISNTFYGFIDEFVANSVQRLTPPIGCAVIEKGEYHRGPKTNSNCDIKEKSPIKLFKEPKYLYMVMQNGRVKKDFKTEEECNAYIEALRDLGKGENLEVRKMFY